MSKKYINTLIGILFAVFCFFSTIWKIDSYPIQMWDESRNAVNAYEMSINHNYLVRHFNGEPDMWETKPPLLIWAQVISIKAFGPNEFSIRLPILIAVLLTILTILFFCYREFNNLLIGIIGSIALLTSSGYYSPHVSRTGDHDALLTLFILLFAICSYKFINTEKIKYLILAFLFLLFGVFTKSIVAFLFVPGVLFYSIYAKKVGLFLKNWKFYLLVVGLIVPIALYYYYRDKYSPGYISHVWNDELFPRYLNKSKNYSYSDLTNSFFYLKNLFDSRFLPGIYIVSVGIIAIFFNKDTKIKQFYLYSLFCIIPFLIIISGGTKNTSYDIPMYPFLSIMVAITIIQLVSLLNLSGWKLYLIYFLLTLCLFSYPFYNSIVKETERLEANDYDRQQYGFFLKKLKHENPECKNIKVIENGYITCLMFYQYVFQDKYGYQIKRVNNKDSLYINDLVILFNDQLIDVGKYNYDTINTYKKCLLIQIKEKK
jgi:4-amino-4-deoxy-L-arabinose transferase-like glycosyltransferase